MKQSENTIDRFKKAITNNRFTMDEELAMIQILVNKYNPISISDLAKKRGISQPAISKQLKKGKIMYLELGTAKIIIGEN